MLSSTNIFTITVLVVCAPGLLSLTYGFVQGLRGKVAPKTSTLGMTIDREIDDARRDECQKGLTDGAYGSPTWYSNTHY